MEDGKRRERVDQPASGPAQVPQRERRENGEKEMERMSRKASGVPNMMEENGPSHLPLLRIKTAWW